MSYVYRIFGREEELLYVGVTDSIEMRIKQHMREREWSEEISRYEYEEYKDRREAEIIEWQQIRDLKPSRNRKVPISRNGKVQIAGFFDPSIRVALKRMALNENKSLQDLLGGIFERFINEEK